MFKKLLLLATVVSSSSIFSSPTDETSTIGWDLYREGKYSEALTIFQNTLSINPNDLHAQQGQAYALFKSKQYHLALLSLPRVMHWENTQKESAHFHDPHSLASGQDYNAQSMLAWSLYYIGKPKDAAQYFYANLDRHPNWDNSLTGLGYTALEREDKTLAQSSFRQALKLNPKNQQAQRGLDASKALQYGFEVSLFGSIAEDDHESPYEKSSNGTVRMSYHQQRNHVTLQTRFNRLEERNNPDRISANKSTLSWVHFIPRNAVQKWATRLDVHYVTHDDNLYDGTTVPYVALMYFDQSHEQYYDVGYATAHFSKPNTINQITLNQVSATAGRAYNHRRFWSSLRVLGQHIHQDNDQAKNQSYWSVTALGTYHWLPEKLDVSAYLSLGERQYTYKPNLYTIYDRLDKQQRALGSSVHYKINPNMTLIADYHHDRYEHKDRHFGVDWYSLGLSYLY